MPSTLKVKLSELRLPKPMAAQSISTWCWNELFTVHSNMELHRSEIIKSYIAVRNILGLANPGKNQILNLSFEETKTELFIKNGVTNKRLLLLTRLPFGGNWILATTYGVAEPIANYLRLRINRCGDVSPTEVCMNEIEQLFDYKS